MNVRFVTGNVGKAAEAAATLAPLGILFERVGLDLRHADVDGLEEVATAKAESLRGQVAPPYFVEDAGLFIDALAGFPGVYSAYVFRTLGNHGILRLLHGERQRGATFRAVVAYVSGKAAPRLFSGRCAGSVLEEPRGRNGFGFDPIFRPEGRRRSFAQMEAAEKNARSHRGDAMRRFAASFAPARRPMIRRASGRGP